MPWSWVDTEYSIHQVLHHSMINCLLLPANFTSLGGCARLSTFSQLRINQWIESQPPSRLPPDLLPPSTSPILIDHGLQVYLPTCSPTASKCISEFTRCRPPSVSPNTLDHGLRVNLSLHSIAVLKCISTLAWSRPPCSSLSSLHHHNLF